MDKLIDYIMSSKFESHASMVLIPFCYVVCTIYLIRVVIFLYNFLTN